MNTPPTPPLANAYWPAPDRLKSATRNTPETTEQARYILIWRDRG